MNEHDWLTCVEREPMLQFMDDKSTRRKFNLCRSGLWRCVWHLLDKRVRHLLEVREAYFDGLATEAEDNAAVAAAEAVPHVMSIRVWDAIPPEYHFQVIRDVFGNPFRPVWLDPVWLTWNSGAIPELAQHIYNERAFERMPGLAQALENAGCTDADILAHCRQSTAHWRGCWIIDHILGKT